MYSKWCKLTADLFTIAWKTDLIIGFLKVLFFYPTAFLWKENKIYNFQSQHPQLDFSSKASCNFFKVTWDTFPT